MKFKPEDFNYFSVAIAAQANARLEELLPDLKKQWLEELLRDAPKVSGKMVGDNMASAWSSWSIRSYNDTHTAKLVCIEEVKP